MPAPGGLDSGPPLPPGMGSAQPSASMSQMAGQGAAQSGQPAGAASSSLQSSVIQDFMLAEKALQSAASKLPQFAPIADDIIQKLRAQGANALAQASQPSGAAQNPMNTILSSIGAAPQM